MLHINIRITSASTYARATRTRKAGAAKRAQAASTALPKAAPRPAFEAEPKLAEPAPTAPAKVSLIKQVADFFAGIGKAIYNAVKGVFTYNYAGKVRNAFWKPNAQVLLGVPTRAQYNALYQPKTTAETYLTALSNLQLMFVLRGTVQASLKAGDTSTDASVLTFRAAALINMVLTESEKSAKIVPDAMELRRRVKTLYVKDHPDKLKLVIDDSSELASARQTMWTLRDHLRDVLAIAQSAENVRGYMSRLLAKKTLKED